jgi:hypothetical protein
MHSEHGSRALLDPPSFMQHCCPAFGVYYFDGSPSAMYLTLCVLFGVGSWPLPARLLACLPGQLVLVSSYSPLARSRRGRACARVSAGQARQAQR